MMDEKHLKNKYNQINEARKLLELDNGSILQGWKEVYNGLIDQMYEIEDQIKKIEEGK